MIDWGLMILLLRKNGSTDVRTAKMVGLTPASLKNYVNRGSEPRFSIGVRLLIYAHEILPLEELQQCRSR